jgi:adenylyl-sulfate kinase
MSVLWFSGLSGAGKTTLGQALQKRWVNRGYPVILLDGDVVRKGLCSDLGFTGEDRTENLRRISEVAAMLANQGITVITTFISPYESHRIQARQIIADHFHHVYLNADLETCQKRDPKGLYAKALRGEIEHFTGITDPFEEPRNADLIVDTAVRTIEESLEQLEQYWTKHRLTQTRLIYGQ